VQAGAGEAVYEALGANKRQGGGGREDNVDHRVFGTYYAQLARLATQHEWCVWCASPLL
jgi:hypothetical protein